MLIAPIIWLIGTAPFIADFLGFFGSSVGSSGILS